VSTVVLRGLCKRFDGARPALDDLSLAVEAGEFLVLLGPSGCGKTTALRCIAGLEQPTAGDILIADRRVNDVPPRDRDVAMVFQNYALYPHLTVRENIGFPLRMRRLATVEVRRRVDEAAAVLGLAALLDRRPGQLSGGERQRAALGRAIVRQPKVFLFDEPLSNLDAKLRSEMRAELMALHRRLGATMLYVTHDQVEAMTMGRRIAVLKDGRLQQVGTPRAIYAEPANAFVAGFIGTPGMNLVSGERGAGSGEQAGAREGGRAGERLGFRPEDAKLGPAEGDEWAGTVHLVEPLGAETLVHVRLDGGETAIVRVREGEPPLADARVGLLVDADRLHRFDGVTGERRAP
jgi:multiple sugar transport system ATP-binding protein